MGNTRLLSLTGLAGCGKTRLAVQVARKALADFEDGVYFIPLAPIVSADSILWTIGEHLGIQFYPHIDPLQQLLDTIRKKKLLLVLDNFEHLLDGTGIVTSILHAASHVRVIVTSRERLSLYGEVNYTITGLSLSDDSPNQSEAVELFTQRARSVAPGLELDEDALDQVARICKLMEGMPLGIELAATWVDVLSPQEIADEIESSLDILEAELRDLPERSDEHTRLLRPVVEFAPGSAKDRFSTAYRFFEGDLRARAQWRLPALACEPCKRWSISHCCIMTPAADATKFTNCCANMPRNNSIIQARKRALTKRTRAILPILWRNAGCK